METTDGVQKSRETLDRVNDLKDRLSVLKTSFTENELNVQRAATEADRAEELANRVEQVRTCFEVDLDPICGWHIKKFIQFLDIVLLSVLSFCITSVHLSFGLPIFQCPFTSMFSLQDHPLTFFTPIFFSLCIFGVGTSSFHSSNSSVLRFFTLYSCPLHVFLCNIS